MDSNDDFGWQTPTNLGANINAAGDDGFPRYFENDGRPQLFYNSARGGVRPDLFVSSLQSDGTWDPATRISELNSAELDTSPTIRQDGLEILFNSRSLSGRHQRPVGLNTEQLRGTLVAAGQPHRAGEQQRQ